MPTSLCYMVSFRAIIWRSGKMEIDYNEWKFGPHVRQVCRVHGNEIDMALSAAYVHQCQVGVTWCTCFKVIKFQIGYSSIGLIRLKSNSCNYCMAIKHELLGICSSGLSTSLSLFSVNSSIVGISVGIRTRARRKKRLDTKRKLWSSTEAQYATN